jgi:hypothetical protein
MISDPTLKETVGGFEYRKCVPVRASKYSAMTMYSYVGLRER